MGVVAAERAQQDAEAEVSVGAPQHAPAGLGADGSMDELAASAHLWDRWALWRGPDEVCRSWCALRSLAWGAACLLGLRSNLSRVCRWHEMTIRSIPACMTRELWAGLKLVVRPYNGVSSQRAPKGSHTWETAGLPHTWETTGLPDFQSCAAHSISGKRSVCGDVSCKIGTI